MPRLCAYPLIATLLAAFCVPAIAGPVPSDFNAFIFNNFTASNSDSEGNLVVGGNVNLSGYGVNTQNKSGKDDPGIVAGGNVNLTNGQIWGDAYVGEKLTLKGAGLLGTGFQNYEGLSYLDSWETYYKDLSTNISGKAATGSVTRTPWGALQFVHQGVGDAVFSLTTEWLSGIHTLDFTGLTKGQSLTLNVTGESAWMKNLDLTRSLGQYDTLLNFEDARELKFENTSPWADVLAPFALFTSANGHLQGTLVADSWKSNFELHEGAGKYLQPPKATPPTGSTPIPEPGTVALLLAATFAFMAAKLAAGRRLRRIAANRNAADN